MGVSKIWYGLIRYQYSSRKFNTWRSHYRIHSILHVWLVVSTPLKNNSQNGNLPQIGMKIKNILSHQLVIHSILHVFIWCELQIRKQKSHSMGLKHSSFVVAVDLFIEDPTWKVIVATTHLRCDVAKRTGFFATNWGWNPCRFVEGQVLCIGLVFLWVSPKQRALSPVSASFSSQCQKTVNRNAIDVFFKEQKWVLTTSWRAPPMFTSRQAVNF